MNRPITFDRFIRALATACGIGLFIYVARMLSGVLLPFLVALLLAYLTYPLVAFLQYRCRLRSRLLCIMLTALLLIAAALLLGYALIPPMIEQGEALHAMVADYVARTVARHSAEGLDTQLEQWLRSLVADGTIQQWLMNANLMGIAKEVLPRVAGAVTQTFGMVMGIFSCLIGVLYWAFILLDYETITEGWPALIPSRYRSQVQMVVGDVEQGMRRYFKMQALIAAIVGVLFAIGFTLIGLPMAIGLGLFIGLLNLVPYLQTIGLVPAVLLALLQAAQTGGSPWTAILLVLAVFAVVQAIQDGLLTPRIMGDGFGLNPAVMLLSLSIWGALLGFIGLIIALPLTSVVISYYRRYVAPPEPGDQPQD